MKIDFLLDELNRLAEESEHNAEISLKGLLRTVDRGKRIL